MFGVGRVIWSVYPTETRAARGLVCEYARNLGWHGGARPAPKGYRRNRRFGAGLIAPPGAVGGAGRGRASESAGTMARLLPQAANGCTEGVLGWRSTLSSGTA